MPTKPITAHEAAWAIADMNLPTPDHNECAPIISRLLDGDSDAWSINSAKEIAKHLVLRDLAAERAVKSLVASVKAV